MSIGVTPCCFGDYVSTSETLGTTQEINGKPVLLYCDSTTLLCEYVDDKVLAPAGVKGNFTLSW